MEQKANLVNWFEIYVDEMSRAQSFYENVLGKMLEEMPMPDEESSGGFQMAAFPWVENGSGAPGALVKATDMKPGGNSIVIYFSCEDCSNEESRVEGAGGKVLKEKFSIGEYGFCSICMDTEGNTFGLHSMK